MHKLCRIDIGRSEEVYEKIERYISKLVEEIDPQKVILFGSFARGDFHQGSDVDLVVIADWSQGFLDRIRILLELNSELPLEPIGYTPEEFSKMLSQGNRFAQRILEEGIVIYEKR